MSLEHDCALAYVRASASETPSMAPTRCRASSLCAFAHAGRPGRENLGMSAVGVASFPEPCLVEVRSGDPMCLEMSAKISGAQVQMPVAAYAHTSRQTDRHFDRQTDRLCVHRTTHIHIQTGIQTYTHTLVVLYAYFAERARGLNAREIEMSGRICAQVQIANHRESVFVRDCGIAHTCVCVCMHETLCVRVGVGRPKIL